MPAVEDFNIIAFRSRQHALYLNQILKREGYEAQMMSTPKGIALGCGLSLRFSPHQTDNIIQVYKHNKVPIIGFYSIRRVGNCCELKRIPCDI